jgi:2'-5' RNA ligase
MEDFFAQIERRWPAGREDLHWHVLPGPALVRDRLAAQYRRLIHRSGLAPVRPRWAHITIQHYAPVAAISDRDLAAVAELVRERCAGVTPFEVTAKRAEPWGGGIVCPLHPSAPLRSLWQAATAAAQAVTGDRFGSPPAGFHPHLTLAYTTARMDRAPLQDWLDGSGAVEVALPVTGLALVAQRHNRREITWRVLEQVLLTGPPPDCG